MSVKAHIQSLVSKHEQLESLLHDAQMHHLPTAALKKEKLRIKDEIESLSKLAAYDDYQQAA